jgi:hypothetical protein
MTSTGTGVHARAQYHEIAGTRQGSRGDDECLDTARAGPTRKALTLSVIFIDKGFRLHALCHSAVEVDSLHHS